MKRSDKPISSGLVDKEYLRRCFNASPEERLRELESLNEFFSKAMPEENRKIWQKLKEKGW